MKVENQRSDSTSSPNSSTRTARSSVAGIDVEDAAAHGELPALEDLLLALVAARDQPLERLVEVELLADRDREAVRAQLRVGDPLHQRDGACDHDRRLAVGRLEQRVERGDPQADEVRRRREVRLVAHAAGRVEAHGRGAQERAQVEREVAGHAVVGGDDQRRAAARTASDSSSAAIRNGRSDADTKAALRRRRPPRGRGARASSSLVGSMSE